MTEFLCALSFGTGLFGMLSVLLGLPTYKTAKNARRARGKQTELIQRLQRTLLLPALKCVAPFVRLEPWKEKKIEQQLNRAGIPLTPREYYAISSGVLFLLDIVKPPNLVFLLYTCLEVYTIFGADSQSNFYALFSPFHRQKRNHSKFYPDIGIKFFIPRKILFRFQQTETGRYPILNGACLFFIGIILF